MAHPGPSQEAPTSTSSSCFASPSALRSAASSDTSATSTARPAGLRTHAVVALASATFMVVSTHMAYYQHYKAGELVEVDGSRIAASVVSGIGFLAGGAILRNGITVQGLTTAAGLCWCRPLGCAPVGGMYIESVAATVDRPRRPHVPCGASRTRMTACAAGSRSRWMTARPSSTRCSRS